MKNGTQVYEAPQLVRLPIHRIRVAGNPVLEALQRALRQVALDLPLDFRPAPAVGNWRSDIDAGPPSFDRSRPLNYNRTFLQKPAIDLPPGCFVASCNYFPAGGGLGWHTDNANPGWRVYLALPLGPVRGEFITTTMSYFDEPGVATAFRVDRQSWHAVCAEGPRLSIGVYFRAGTLDLGVKL